MSSCDDLSDVAAHQRDNVLAALKRAFPNLSHEAEDIFQESFLEGFRKAREGFVPREGWKAWLQWTARNRALDRLRERERQLFFAWSSGEEALPQPDPSDSSPPPGMIVVERERRQRQGLLLSQVLAEFTRWCEVRPDGFRMKTIYERRVRGESAESIARGLGIPRNTVDVMVKRARDWIYQRICQVDVERTVFATLHGGRGAPLPEVEPNRKGQPSVPYRGPQVVKMGRSSPAEKVPLNMVEVVRWVVEELGAFCPSPDRLAAYHQSPDAPALEDVRYHVQVAKCRICRAGW